MKKRSGWGTLLAIALPLLLWFVWSQLGRETSRIAIEQYYQWEQRSITSFMQDFRTYFLKNKRLAGPGDVFMPTPPTNSGIKSWAINEDHIIVITLDAIINNRPVVLQLVPVISNGENIYYDCVSETSKLHLGNACFAGKVQTVADIPARVVANAEAIKNMPDYVTSTGQRIEPGTAIGSVLAVPMDASELSRCGYQCVKPKKCSDTLQLVCRATKTEGGKRWQAVERSGIQVKGSSIATLADANALCAQALGEGFTIAKATGIGGKVNLDGGYEYWVHEDLKLEKNCWKM